MTPQTLISSILLIHSLSAHVTVNKSVSTRLVSRVSDCANSRPQRVRLYGADCNQSVLVVCGISLPPIPIVMQFFQLEAIKQTKVDMTVWLGNYAIATDNNTAYARQRDAIKSAIQTYGTDHIGGVTVGNEFMLKLAPVFCTF